MAVRYQSGIHNCSSRLTCFLPRFLVEGLICVVIGIISYLVMPASVTEGAVMFRRKDGSNSWWTEDEEKILVNRILRDDPTKGDMNNRQAVNLKGIWKAVVNVDLWPIYLVRPLEQL